jgi:hypothetical protein
MAPNAVKDRDSSDAEPDGAEKEGLPPMMLLPGHTQEGATYEPLTDEER